MRLLQTEQDRKRTWTAFWTAIFILAGIGGTKLALGVSRSKPVGFLIIELIVSLIALLIVIRPWGAYLGEEALKNGIRIKVSTYARHHVNSMMTKAKVTGHYVNSILAKREAVADGYDEALLLDTEGYVSEGSGENIFIIKNNLLKTTPLTSNLKGITRDSVMTIAKDKGFEVKEERFTRDELYIADEAFFTGTAAEITPIREADRRIIGQGKPGPVTKTIQETFFNIVKGKEKKYEAWLTYV